MPRLDLRGTTADDMRRATEATKAEMLTALRRNTPYAPLDHKYRVGKTLVFAMVWHRDNSDPGASPPKPATAHLLSIDGHWQNAKWFPAWGIKIQRSKAEPRFMVVTMGGALANEKQLPTQAIDPQLTGRIYWTDAQRAEWEWVRLQRVYINEGLKRGNRRSYHGGWNAYA